MIHRFGITMSEFEYQHIRQKLDFLQDKCPANCKIHLNFSPLGRQVKGVITIQSPLRSFTSKKIGQNAFLTFLSLQDDIHLQLDEWKRQRFSNKLAQSFTSHQYARVM